MDRNNLLNDPETAMRYALDGRQAMMWTAMPAIVSSVDLMAMTLVAQPAIKGVQTDESGTETFVNLPQLVDVPICFPSAGGFTLTLPIKSGDEVLIVIANRCIDSWWQSGGVQVPMEARMHDLSDGFAIPGPRSQPKVIVGGVHATNAQLRTDAGTTYVEITPTGRVNIVAPSGIGLTGNLLVTGNISSTGEVIAKFGTTPIPLSTHHHPGVTPGGGTTGPAIP